MQIIYTSLQADNHASTSPHSFYRLDALPAAQPTASKHSSKQVKKPSKVAWKRHALRCHWEEFSVLDEWSETAREFHIVKAAD